MGSVRDLNKRNVNSMDLKCAHGKPGMKILGMVFAYSCDACVQQASSVLETAVAENIDKLPSLPGFVLPEEGE